MKAICAGWKDFWKTKIYKSNFILIAISLSVNNCYLVMINDFQSIETIFALNKFNVLNKW